MNCSVIPTANGRHADLTEDLKEDTDPVEEVSLTTITAAYSATISEEILLQYLTCTVL